MTKVISFLNQKGGVGKSTILFHYAHYLVEEGKRVLVCDMDTQGNVSSALLGDDYNENSKGYYPTGLLLGTSEDKEKTIVTNEKGISVIYADDTLIDAEDLDINNIIKSVENNINKLKESYDYILFDCPPTVGKRVLGALYSSTNVITPIEPRKFAIDGLSSLIQTILAVQTDRPELNFEGVVINRVNSRSPQQKRNIKMIREALGKQVFLNELVEREPISDAIENRRPVWAMPKSGSSRVASKEMKALLAEFEWRLN